MVRTGLGSSVVVTILSQSDEGYHATRAEEKREEWLEELSTADNNQVSPPRLIAALVIELMMHADPSPSAGSPVTSERENVDSCSSTATVSEHICSPAKSRARHV